MYCLNRTIFIPDIFKKFTTVITFVFKVSNYYFIIIIHVCVYYKGLTMKGSSVEKKKKTCVNVCMCLGF